MNSKPFCKLFNQNVLFLKGFVFELPQSNNIKRKQQTMERSNYFKGKLLRQVIFDCLIKSNIPIDLQ